MRYFGCAALRGVRLCRESVINPQKYYDNNVVGTLSLLRAMLETDTSTIVFSSSCAIYGEPEQVPIVEDAAKQPVNPYGASKLMIERVLSDYTRAYGLQSVALRYFNAAGADPDSEVGELRDPETHLIPRAMMAIQGYLNDFAVFGSDYPTPDGTAIRDYIHVADLAEAHVAALRRLQSGKAKWRLQPRHRTWLLGQARSSRPSPPKLAKFYGPPWGCGGKETQPSS